VHPPAFEPRPQPVAGPRAQGGEVDPDVIRAALTGVLDAVLVVDQSTDRIVYANQACVEHFRYPLDELIGQRIELLVPRQQRSLHRSHRAAYVGSPVARRMDQRGDIQALRKDGTVFPAEISLATVTTASGPYVTAVVRDATASQEARRLDEEARRRAARDARIAAVLQLGMMPYVPRSLGPIRVASRYRAAGQGEAVGGDWADVFALPDGRIGLVVGDVAGHGIEAAATMTRLRALVRMLASGGLGPAEVMGRLNDAADDGDLGGDPTDDVTLATIVHAQLDPATGRLVYSSAGHLPLLYSCGGPTDGLAGGATSAATSAVALAAACGPPIGAVPEVVYDEHTSRLAPGSRLVGFTDGLIETRTGDLDENLRAVVDNLGRAPTATVTDVELLADHLLDIGPGDGRDDIALLVVGYEPQPQRGAGA
jgi:PAS domain S-box-containing protein